MTAVRRENLEEFLEDSFGEGVRDRQLRLTSEQVEYIKLKYPKVSIVKCNSEESPDGKFWWQLTLTNS